MLCSATHEREATEIGKRRRKRNSKSQSFKKEGAVNVVKGNKSNKGTSLVVHWLRHHSSIAGGTGLIPGWGTKIPALRSYISLHEARAKKKKEKIKGKKKGNLPKPGNGHWKGHPLCPWLGPQNAGSDRNTNSPSVDHVTPVTPLFLCPLPPSLLGFPGGSEGKASACSARDPASIPGLGRSPGEGNGNPLQYSCLENPMDEAW